MLMKELKALVVKAMKEKNNSVKEILQIVIGKIDNEGKLRNNTDEQVEKQVILEALQSTHKSLVKSKADLMQKIGTEGFAMNAKIEEFFNKTDNDIKILESLLPKKMSIEELTEVITKLHNEGKDKKAILTQLKEQYNGLYDGKTAFEIANKL